MGSAKSKKQQSGAADTATAATEEEVFDVEKLLDYGLVDGVWKYEVKWVGYTKTSWEPPEHLADAGLMLHDYWVGQHQHVQEEKQQQPEKKKTPKKAKMPPRKSLEKKKAKPTPKKSTAKSA